MRPTTLPQGLGLVSPLGLGCGRLGSMTGDQSPEQARALIEAALDLGVNVFDTANIYAQGRSERLIGEAVGRSTDICIITKAGQFFPLRQRLLAPLRGPASALLKRSSAGQAAVRAVRRQGLPRNFSREHLTRSLEASLRRVKRDAVEIFLLHSPRPEHLVDGDALDTIVELKRRGLAKLVGVSCDDAEVLDLVAEDARAEVLQVPFGIARRGLEAGVARAARRGALVIAREVLSSDAEQPRPAPAEAVRFCIQHADVTLALIGTSNPEHLRQAVDSAG